MSEKKLIMVVDDDPDLVEAVSMKLESKNYKVIQAYDGEQAIESLKTQKPDLMILDVMMPHKNGWTVCEEVKTNNGLKNIIVIMLTAVGDAVQTTSYTHHEGKTTLADDYIPKPIDMEQLVRIVNDHLGA
jgi:two-component system, OmpR family, alkaline phosphatase synthesis response regulator PhoP